MDFKDPYLVTVESVYWMPTGERCGLAKVFDTLYPPVRLLPTLTLPKRVLLTSTSVSMVDTISVSLPPRGSLIENMELYPVAERLVSLAKRFDTIIGITNQIGPEASQQWQKNYHSVARLTGDFVSENLCHFQ